MKGMKRDVLMAFSGIMMGAALFCGSSAAAGITAEPSTNPIYVDGQKVEMMAYKIGGNNYVKLRDVGKAVGFNVYWQNGVQVDSAAPYTGEAPVQAEALHLSSYKGNALMAGDRSLLMIGPDSTGCAPVSSNPAVVSLEQMNGKWVIVARSAGTAVITATNAGGQTGRLAVTVKGAAPAAPKPNPNGGVDLDANMEIRQKMVRLINQVRRENGVAELPLNQALMDAAQDTSAHKFTRHTDYEIEVVRTYGYPHGTSTNLTWFNRAAESDIAERAVTNWVNSPFHFQTMTAARYDCLGVGVTIENDIAYCFMFVGNPNGVNP